MSADMRDEILKILKDCFPGNERGVMAPFDFSSADKDDFFSDASCAARAEQEAHLAVHKNDKWHRDYMRRKIVDKLHLGAPLYPAEYAWLIYVLLSLDDAPCACNNGRPVDGNEEAMNRLALVAFIIDDEIKNPGNQRGYITARLKRAAEALCKSYESVRKIYYSESFAPLLERMRKRGFNPLRVK